MLDLYASLRSAKSFVTDVVIKDRRHVGIGDRDLSIERISDGRYAFVRVIGERNDVAVAIAIFVTVPSLIS